MQIAGKNRLKRTHTLKPATVLRALTDTIVYFVISTEWIEFMRASLSIFSRSNRKTIAIFVSLV